MRVKLRTHSQAWMAYVLDELMKEDAARAIWGRVTAKRLRRRSAAAPLLALIPTAAPAQPEPVILHCKEVKAEGADPERFFIQLDVDEKVVRFHRRNLPPMKMLMVESWRVEFADHEKSPTLLGTINQITGDISIERVGSPSDRPEAARAPCGRAAPVF